ncbi:MAG: dihydrolipoyl dehydrogenase [Chloroflexota bacterium]
MGEETLKTQVAVIGGGPGGYAAAFRAADLGLDVTLVNAEERLGGTCLLRGCIPSKFYLEIGRLVADARQAGELGVRFGEPEIDLATLREHKNRIVDRLAAGLEQLCKQRNIELIRARATFESSRRIRLQDADLSAVEFEHTILAAGSRPRGLDGIEYTAGGRIMDSSHALELPDIPGRLLLVGGGFISLGLASLYISLGSQVTLIEATGGLLPGTDRDLVETMQQQARGRFEALHCNTHLVAAEERPEGVAVRFEGEIEQPEQTFDRVLIAVGRVPNTDGLGLENTAVNLDASGYVQVDEQRRTGDDAIFAIGDVTGEPMLAHKAMYEGKVAAEAIAGKPAAYDVRAVPAVVYNDPEVAWCGLTETQAADQNVPVAVERFPWRASGRALAKGAAEGMTKLIFDPDSGRLLGMGIVGPGAETLIAEGVLAIEMGAVAKDLALTMHPHPTLSETEAEAAEAFLGLATHLFRPE